MKPIPIPGASLTYFIDVCVCVCGGGGVRGIIFGSEILAKGIFWVYIKRLGFFWVAKKHRVFCVFYFPSPQINSNVSAIYSCCGIFGGCAKNVGILGGRQILKLGLFGV